MSNLDIRCRMTFVAVAFLLDLYSTPHLFGQASPIPGRDSVLNSVSEQLRTQFGTLRFHREEGFEDQFLPNVPSTTELELAPHFYKIEMPRFDHASGSALVHSGNGGLPTMYVGTSADERKVYRLYGFTDPEVEFNRLVGDIPFKKIGGTSDAETRGLLCAEIVYGLSDRWWVADPSNAKLQAAEHFFALGHEDGLLLGQRWWGAIKGNRSALSINTTRKEGDEFVVNLPVFWAPLEGASAPKIQIYRIEVSDAGACHMNPKPFQVLE